MYDIAIIGAGPAGLSAAITARARNKEVLLISNKPQDNPLAKSHVVDNYPGMPQISGLQLLEQMTQHAERMGAQFICARVISLLSMGTHFAVTTSEDFIEARSLIIATGAQRTKAIVGEEEFLGRGVSYCATCDGMLYRNAEVVVIGQSAESIEEANFLASIGAHVVFVGEVVGEADKPTHELREDILVRKGRPLAIQGNEAGVTGLLLAEKHTEKDDSDTTCQSAFQEDPCQGDVKSDSLGSNPEQLICAKGVFILRDSIAPSALISELALTEDKRAIAADAQMRTNIAGIFAAGDCLGAPLQIAKAAGEGQVAALSAVTYLGIPK